MVENIYQSNIIKFNVKKILLSYYSNLGKIGRIYKFSKEGFNSQIYVFFINKKKYIIKIIPNPDDIYGKKSSHTRMSIITNIISKLSKKHCFENFLKNNNGKFITRYKNSIIRVAEYIESNPRKTNSEIVLKRSIKKINKLHGSLWNNLEVSDKKKLKKLSIPYTLKKSYKKRKKIKLFLMNEIKKKKTIFSKGDLKIIINNFELLCDNISRVKDIESSSFFKIKGFTHNDFHQDNIIISKNKKIYLLDFDNIQYSEIFRCLYFFLLRFSSYKKNINENTLIKNYDLLKNNYNCYRIPSYKDSLKYLLYVELEKIFKILCRISEKYFLTVFVKKIITLHLPNVCFLITTLDKYEIESKK
jgi:thiamine kinase-like enzyme